MVQFTSLLSLSASAALLASTDATIHRNLRETLQTKGIANVIVKMKQGTKTTLTSYVKPLSGSRGQKIQAMRNALQNNARESQKSVLDSLNQIRTLSAKADYESLWISNEVYVRGATFEVLEKLQKLPNVAEIYEEKVIQIEALRANEADTFGKRLYPEWGIERIKVPDVWDMGVTGKGVKIGSIDTGVQVNHEALIDNYVGSDNYGWYAPEDKGSKTPYDLNGHGTHTVGTIVGKGGIGVAPNAQWMACTACTAEGCSEYALKACGEFMTCPHDAYGENEDCSLAPDLVSNSWGGDQGDTFFDDVIEAWHDAGIIPVFAIGNEGYNGCGSANSPGDSPRVIAVGATSDSDGIASLSSQGPPILDSALIKPDITAPGLYIRSAWISDKSNNVSRSTSGTSMACPHVSGVIALMLEEYPDAGYYTIYEILMKTTNQNLQYASRRCGDLSSSIFPNHIFGHGLIDGFHSCNVTSSLN